MIKFSFGFLVGGVVCIRYRTEIVRQLEEWRAMIQLKQDLLHHDHPHLRDPSR